MRFGLDLGQVSAKCKVQVAPVLVMLAGLGRARQVQGAMCKVQGARCPPFLDLD